MAMQRIQRGVAAVELGLLLVPLVTLIFGVTEFGRAMYQYNAIAKSVRAAARFLSQYEAGTLRAEAKCIVLKGNTGCTGQFLVPGLSDPLMVQVEDSENTPALKSQSITADGTTVGVTNLVRVTVSGFSFVPVVSYVVTKPIPFEPISVTMTQAIP